MKKMILIGLLTLTFSCKKENITPGNYTPTAEKKDTSKWQDKYTNSGVIPTFTNSSQLNEAVGTKWVLTYLQIGFSTPPLPIDTILFINNNQYTINNGSARTYQLYSGVTTSSKTLVLNFHYPFGSGNYTGQISSTFISDAVILNCEFTNTNTPTIKVKASFIKI